MPKVTPEYFHKKKQSIVEAAVNVCIRKTMSSLTMQDIIDESGLSQGGIYRFYGDIDEILSDVIRFIRKENTIKGNVKRIIQQEKSPAEIVYDMYDMLALHMEQYLLTYHKISFEFNIFISNFPDRAHKIITLLSPEEGNMEYLYRLTSLYLNNSASSGKIIPLIPIDELMAFISASYEGILSDVIIRRKFYGTDNTQNNITVLMKTLSKTMVYLMGIKEE